MHEPIDEGDHAGGIGEDLVPFAEGFVRGQNDAAVQLIAAGDDLEEQVGITGVVGEIARPRPRTVLREWCNGAAGAPRRVELSWAARSCSMSEAAVKRALYPRRIA